MPNSLVRHRNPNPTPNEPMQLHKLGLQLLGQFKEPLKSPKSFVGSDLKVLADKMRVEYNKSWSRADAIREVHKRSCNNPAQLNVAPEIEATECPTQSSNSLETSPTATTVCVTRYARELHLEKL